MTHFKGLSLNCFSNESGIVNFLDNPVTHYQIVQQLKKACDVFLSLNGSLSDFVPKCGPIFQKKYANIMEYHCPGSPSFFSYLKTFIGEKKPFVVRHKDGKPAPPDITFKQVKECVWEYDILGLISIVTIWIIGGIIAIVLVVFVILIVWVQKHRVNTRKRLEGNLLSGKEMNMYDVFVCTPHCISRE